MLILSSLVLLESIKVPDFSEPAKSTNLSYVLNILMSYAFRHSIEIVNTEWEREETAFSLCEAKMRFLLPDS